MNSNTYLKEKEALLPSLSIQNLKKNYKKKPVLKDISLSASQSTCVGILGSNGSGKSTLLSILAGIIRPDGGRVLWNGSDLLTDNAFRSGIVGYVPQGTPLLEELTAYDNLRLWYEKEALAYELDQGRLAMLGIPDFLKVPVCKMSLGMKKRLSIGCSIANRPKLLLLDEPSAALDLVCKEQVLQYMNDFKKQGGILLLVTHDIQEIQQCDQCFLLQDGVLLPYTYSGNPSELASRLAQ